MMWLPPGTNWRDALHPIWAARRIRRDRLAWSHMTPAQRQIVRAFDVPPSVVAPELARSDEPT